MKTKRANARKKNHEVSNTSVKPKSEPKVKPTIIIGWESNGMFSCFLKLFMLEIFLIIILDKNK